jgi:hypothetical protein
VSVFFCSRPVCKASITRCTYRCIHTYPHSIDAKKNQRASQLPSKSNLRSTVHQNASLTYRSHSNPHALEFLPIVNGPGTSLRTAGLWDDL